MNIDSNDHRITAYALGELDESERAAIEAQIEQSEELQQAVADIRATAELLTKELQAEPVATLTPDQRNAIEAKAAELNGKAASVARRHTGFWRRYWLPTTAAASLLLALGIWLVAASLFSYPGRAQPQLASESQHRNLPAVRQPPVVDELRGVCLADGASWVTNADSSSVSVYPGMVAPPVAQLHIALDTGHGVADMVGSQPEQTLLVSAYGRVGGVASYEYDGGDTRDYPVVSGAHRASEGWDNISDEYEPRSATQESYDHITENPFLSVSQNPLSTFSIDVDTASYANVRRFLNAGQLPPPGAVRIEEMVNYFDYDYPLPTGDDPFSVIVDVADCPWNPDHLLARIGIKGQEFAPADRPPANLVFLIDVSGSMQPHNKLLLLKDAMRMLVEELSYDDSVAMVVYAGASGLVLDSTSCDDKGTILAALDDLQAGGSTNGGAGIQLAYDIAIDNFIEGGINRVILATDGDFNVGTTDRSSLTELIEEKAKSGVFLSVLGFGMGNYKDATLENLADKGNGNYAYIDTLNEARKVLVEQLTGTLMTIAKDVKIQIEFNPVEVSAYRLIGYENRLLAAEDFNDDTKDAGEIGAGHTVTAFYEIVPGGIDVDLPTVDPLRYQVSPADTVSEDAEPRGLKPAAQNGELMTVKLRYKQPDGDTSRLIEVPVKDEGLALGDMPDDFIFAASVASFGMLLRSGGPIPAPRSAEEEGPTQNFTFDAVREMAEPSVGEDPFGYRAEFITLVQRATSLSSTGP